MFTEGYSFPHPVLGNEDDIEGQFNISIAASRTSERKIVFEIISVELSNQYISRLVQEGLAKVFAKVHCSSTLTTWVVEVSKQFDLEENEIDNKVEIQFFVVTISPISKYSDSSFNTQYGSQDFGLNKNEVIAISGAQSIKIPKVNEKLGLGNIFKFHSHQTDWPISFQLMQDKIFINYPVTKNGEHPPNMLFAVAPWTAFNIFIVPALTEALRFIDEEPEVARKFDWFTAVDQMLPIERRTKNFYGDAQSILQMQLPVVLACEELSKR